MPLDAAAHARVSRRALGLGILGGAAGPLLTSCARVPAARDASVLTVAMSVEPASLDMLAGAAVAPAQLQLFNVYETLVKVDASGAIRPLLASGWELSADRRTYTFQMAPSAAFASGAPVTAHAVAANLTRVQTAPGIAAKHKAAMKVVTGVKALDERTLQVTLAAPSNTWLYAIGDTVGAIADPASFAQLAAASFGSGPYQVAQWQRGDSITLTRNPRYWGATPAYEQVRFKFFADPNAMNAALLSGSVDLIASEPNPDALVQFADASQFQVLQGTTNAEVVLGLNNQSPVLADVRVRRAIAQAIDKKKLLANVSAGKGTVLGTMDVPTDPYYEDLAGINAYDPDAARSLLAEAGRASGLTLRLKPAALFYASSAAQQVASDLKAVGVNTVITEQQFPAAWLDTVYKRADYDLTIVGHLEARDLVTYTNPAYYWRYSSPAFNAAYAAADRAEPDQYAPLMRKAARILADDAASVWLYALPNLPVARTGITGIAVNQLTDAIDITGVRG